MLLIKVMFLCQNDKALRYVRTYLHSVPLAKAMNKLSSEMY